MPGNRDNEAAQRWFEATDLFLDSITDASLKMELFRLASPLERLIILKAQLVFAVEEFFREPMTALKNAQNALTPEEKTAWLTTVRETKETT